MLSFNWIISIIPNVFNYFRKPVSITVTNDDKSFYALISWLHENGTLNSINSVEVDVLRSNDNYDYMYMRSKPENCGEMFFRYIPEIGVKIDVILNGRKVSLLRQRQMIGLVLCETMKLTSYGCERKFLEDIVEESCIFSERRSQNRITIFTATSGVWEIYWRQLCRPITSIFLDNEIVDTIVNNVRKFLDAEKWYEERSIPHRRGYLFYGPSGCGKTSLIRALATEFDHAICEVNLKDSAMSDKTLAILFNSIPKECFLLLEDIDALFSTRNSEIHYEDQYNKVTFSNLLNCIDGMGASSKGKIIFMTSRSTNLENIDSTLIRPGRIDKRQFIDYPSNGQIKKLFTHFYPDADEALFDNFEKKLQSESKTRSVAELQSHILQHSQFTIRTGRKLLEGRSRITLYVNAVLIRYP